MKKWMAHLQSLSKDISLPASQTSSFTLFTRFRALCSSATLEMIARRRPLSMIWSLCLCQYRNLSNILTFCRTVLHSLNPLAPWLVEAEGLDEWDRCCSWGCRFLLKWIYTSETRRALVTSLVMALHRNLPKSSGTIWNLSEPSQIFRNLERLP